MLDGEKYPFLASGSSPAPLPAARSAPETPEQDPFPELAEELHKAVREDAHARGVQLEDTNSKIKLLLQEETRRMVASVTRTVMEEQADMTGICVFPFSSAFFSFSSDPRKQGAAKT